MKRIIAVLLAAIYCVCFATGYAESMTFKKVSSALKYIQENHPSELTLENVTFRPTDLLKIKEALPDGAEFHFTSVWENVEYSDKSAEIETWKNEFHVTTKDMEAIIQICPHIKVIDNSHQRNPPNREMIPLIEKYPDVRFEWMINLGGGHYLPSTDETFTTMNHIGQNWKKLTSKQLKLLKYCKNLKALDLGHNDITDLDFLYDLPNLELLIIGHNNVKDITPIGSLKHLKYAELFTNGFSDISPLANCTDLIDLNITNCKVSDLSPLDNIQTLERLWGNMLKKLSKEEQERFIDLHPNCETDFKSSHAATVDGWREHPRYKHYIWCFKNKTWVPFDEQIPGVD